MSKPTLAELGDALRRAYAAYKETPPNSPMSVPARMVVGFLLREAQREINVEFRAGLSKAKDYWRSRHEETEAWNAWVADTIGLAPRTVSDYLAEARVMSSDNDFRRLVLSAYLGEGVGD